MPDEAPFSLVGARQAQTHLTQLLQKVCKDKGRIEIQHSHGTCVLISKEELESLEEALEILSNTSDVQKMARTIAVLTHSVAKAPLACTTRVDAN